MVLIYKSPSPTCDPISHREKDFITAMKGVHYFHFLGHEGLHVLLRRHAEQKTDIGELEWAASSFPISSPLFLMSENLT
jgi:hypothetical protein